MRKLALLFIPAALLLMLLCACAARQNSPVKSGHSGHISSANSSSGVNSPICRWEAPQ